MDLKYRMFTGNHSFFIWFTLAKLVLTEIYLIEGFICHNYSQVKSRNILYWIITTKRSIFKNKSFQPIDVIPNDNKNKIP